MSKFRKIAIALLSVCCTACATVGLAACKPDVIQSDNQEANFVINLNSVGGLKLDGVKIAVKKDGEIITEAVSVNGRIPLEINPDEYELVVESMPAGYYVPEGTTFKTTADDKEFNVSLPSKVITDATIPVGKSYKIGDVMYDFKFADAVTGLQYSLADMFELDNKKAVILNFWGTQCQPCQLEFPAIQEAYDDYKDDLEIFALSSYMNDSKTAVSNFKTLNNYTFPMAVDTPGIYTYFNVSAYPTSVVIDRYGVVAMTHSTDTSAASWRAIFERFTADDYSQDPGENNGGEESFEWEKHNSNVSMPDSATIADAINGNGADGKVLDYYYNAEDEEDDEYNFPWIVKEEGGNKYLAPSNTGVDHSYSIFRFDVKLKAGEGLSFDYFTDTKTSDNGSTTQNNLYILINGVRTDYYCGNSNGWQTIKGIYVAKRSVTLTISFCYIKTAVVNVETPVGIDNISVYDASGDGEAIDLAFSLAEESTLVNGKYDINLELDSADNTYYYTYTTNTGEQKRVRVYVDILASTLWSDIHYGQETFLVPEEGNISSRKTASLYDFAFWFMSNWRDDDTDTDASEYENAANTVFYFYDSNYVIKQYYLQRWSDRSASDSGLLPLNPQLVEMLKAFINYAHDPSTNIAQGDPYEDEWMELCYYVRHFGEDHKDGEICADTLNTVLGLAQEFALKAEVDTLIHVNDYTTIPVNNGGIYFTFVPTKDGVYYLYTLNNDKYNEYNAQEDPAIEVYDINGRSIAYNDDDLTYNRGSNDYYLNSYLYVELEAGKTYYIRAGMSFSDYTGEFDMMIEYAGTYVEYLKVCTTGDGAFTYKVDPNDNISYMYYIAIDASLNPDDRVYYHYVNHDWGSKIYIDFDSLNDYYSRKMQVSLKELIDLGSYDFTGIGGEDYTDKMLEYYEQSIEGKSKDDELYGKIEATEELAYLVDMLFQNNSDFTGDRNAWMMFACYYEYYGTPSV